MVIEMQIVSAPYILDFGKVYLNFPRQHDPQTLEYCQREREELFGERWPEVQGLLASLESIGIFYQDPKPGNIMFEDWPDD